MKDSMLVTWTSHSFFGSMLNHVIELSERFDIVLGLTNDHLGQEKVNLIDDLMNNGVLSYFFIIDNNSQNALNLYKKLLKDTDRLNEFDFSVWLTGSNILIYERYIESFLLTEKCKKVIYWDGVTYLMERSLPISDTCNKVTRSQSLTERLIRLIDNQGFLFVVKRVRLILLSKLLTMPRLFATYYERVLLPLFLFRRVFKYREHEELTQMTSGNVDAILLTDPVEVEKHKKLYNTDSVFLVQHALSGRCKCTKSLTNKSSAVLSPLTGVVGEDEVSVDFLNTYLDCFKVIFSESGATEVHLRKHPRETGNWPYQLCGFLNKNNIPSTVLESDDLIGEVTCGYLGVAGFASCALRDARNACDYCFVIGFEELSCARYKDPISVFGLGDGIEWIQYKKTYNKKIFKNDKHMQTCNSTVSSIIDGLLDS